MSTQWSFTGLLDTVADAVPDREMLVWGAVRRTHAEFRRRTRALAAYLRGRGLGTVRERAGLERWECGQQKVAVVCSNCPEYLEAMFGAFRARLVPYNVNHHYNAAELAALVEQIGADVIVHHRRFAPLVEEVARDRLMIHVEDGSRTATLPGSVAFEDVIDRGGDEGALPVPSPDDLYLMCTGGTTGRPKGVLWRQADAYVAAAAGSPDATAESIALTARRGGPVWFPAPPLMHAAAQWTVLACWNLGGTVVLHDDAGPFDARAILETAERERVQMLTIVGDAYARPLVEELRARAYDLSALRQISTGGATTRADLKEALLDLLPHVIVVDGYGASETGGMAFGASAKDATDRGFRGAGGAVVLSEDRRRILEPGSVEIGWTARTGHVPLGYLDDPEATERTFPVVDGVRFAVPGDRATVGPDGSITLLGRDSTVVNSGGEKIFVEEVEQAIRRHPDVLDALVVGRPSERFGEEVVALVQLRPGATLDGPSLREYAAGLISRFKAPRAVLFCERVGRHPSGKPDYGWARRAAADAVAVAE
ncbi:MAG: acyl-CoA synthetase [Acidimicrobiia bacterium]|nr:MAG: acyl-CoA synthetase [Acidimicrobiia bacterium]